MKQDGFTENVAEHKFELFVNGERSFIDYQKEGDKVYLLHTQVPEDQSGEGIAASLVEKTFEYLEAQNLKAVPNCSYVRAFLTRHPDWNRIIGED